MRLNKGCNILAHFVIIILFMFCKDIFCQAAPEYSIKVSKSVTVEEHSCVVIPCSFVAGGNTSFSGSHGFWRDKQTNVIAATCNCNDTRIKSNFHITGNPNQGNCTLTITDAKKEDSGEYFFRFEGPVRYNYANDFMNVNLNVTGPTNTRKNHITSVHGHHCTFAPGFSIEVTTSVTVQEGSCITVPCFFTVPNRNSFKHFRGFWKSKNKTTISANCKCSDMDTKTNVHVTGDLDKGDCTLSIINAKKEDSGTYFFRLEEPFNYNYEAKSVTVIVTDIFCTFAPEYSINVNKHVTVEEHSCVVIPCSFVAGGKTSFSGSYGFWRDQQTNVIAATCNCNDTRIKSNFHITGNPNQGNCTLTITDAKKEDSGEYFFRFEGPVSYNYDKNFMKVTVTGPTNTRKDRTNSVHGHHCTFAPGFSIEVNTSVTVQEGSCITVPCSFTVPNRNSFKHFQGFWKSKNKTTISANCKCSDMYTKTNVHVTGDLDKGDCTLGIINAKKEYSGTYFFRLEEPFKYNYEAKSVTVIVTDPPKEPEVTIASSIERNDRIFDLLIGIVSGMAIVISFMLVLKLIAKKYFKMNLCLFVPMEYDSAEELPSGDMKDDIHKEVYSSVQKPKPKTETPKMDKKQHSNNIPSDQEEVHYSSIVFKKHPLGGSPMQPPTEYAEYAEIVK